MDAKEGGLRPPHQLAFILQSSIKLPPSDALLPEVFDICCAHINFGRVEHVSSQKNARGRPPMKKLRSAIELLITSLWIIGSKPMRDAISKQGPIFAGIVEKHWGYIVLTVADIFKFCKSTRSDAASEMPCGRLDLLCILCDALSSLFSVLDLEEIKEEPAALLLQKFAWMLWLSGGPREPDGRSSSAFSSSAAKCLQDVMKATRFDETMMESAADGSRTFGGVPAIAKIALSAFQSSVALGEDIKYHALPFIVYGPAAWIELPMTDFWKAIYDMDGTPALTTSLVRLTKRFQDPFHRLVIADVATIISEILYFIQKSYRNVEKAARCGLLEAIVYMFSNESNLSPSIVDASVALLEMISQYLAFHSVISAVAEEMRKLTEGNGTKSREENISTGTSKLAEAWRHLKRRLIESYCTMRFFDLVIFPNCETKYCSTCGKTQGRQEGTDYQICSCKRVLYCSKQCQITNWEEDGHRENCKKEIDHFVRDIPFLGFLANLFFYGRSDEHLNVKIYGSSGEDDMIFLAFLTSYKPELSVTDEDHANLLLESNLDSFSLEGSLSQPSCRKHPRTERLRKGVSGQDGGVESNAEIGIVTPGSSCSVVVRFMPYDADPRFKFQSEVARMHSPSSSYFNADEGGDIRVTPIWVGRGASDLAANIRKRDVIDNIFAMFYVPGQDPWTRHFRKNGGSFTEEMHILDFIDDCIRIIDGMRYEDKEL
ncbi:hypothetical protein SCHPADRAFT_946290 [Schizopora paradoxa]|uniref:MYND-type domain-containing protein n=1 Tax=Schizopora paradoxa TaxID=27342 RepID=A0A0H2R4D6_9AGAM|nr:hypothetical protein SCHPADRAFT_946290 [Schizopora paradoxa]